MVRYWYTRNEVKQKQKKWFTKLSIFHYPSYWCYCCHHYPIAACCTAALAMLLRRLMLPWPLPSFLFDCCFSSFAVVVFAVFQSLLWWLLPSYLCCWRCPCCRCLCCSHHHKCCCSLLSLPLPPSPVACSFFSNWFFNFLFAVAAPLPRLQPLLAFTIITYAAGCAAVLSAAIATCCYYCWLPVDCYCLFNGAAAASHCCLAYAFAASALLEWRTWQSMPCYQPCPQLGVAVWTMTHPLSCCRHWATATTITAAQSQPLWYLR